MFPFGHGLSYTTFKYANLKVSTIDPEGSFSITFEVTDTGLVSGSEVSLIYISDPISTLPRPVKELKAYAKNEISPGETKTVTIDFEKSALGYWADEEHWIAEAGEFEVLVNGGPGLSGLSSSVTLQKTLTWSGL